MLGNFTIGEMQAVYEIGLWLIAASAVMFLVAFGAVKLLPGYVLHVIVPAWLLGATGFGIICIFDARGPNWFNIGLGIMFLVATAGQGWRLFRRSRNSDSDMQKTSDDRGTQE